MQLHTPFVQLPLSFDVERMTAEVLAFGPADWKPHPQGFPGNSALSLMAVGGDASNDSLKGPMQPTPLLKRSPYLQQVLASFSAPIGRVRLMQVAGQSEASSHFDSNYYWQERVRIHVPIITNPRVRFYCQDYELHLQAGECWIFDTWATHRVDNGGDEPRIHLVVDTVGSPAFWELVAYGDEPFGVRRNTTHHFIEFDPQRRIHLSTEKRNHPVVMSPEEQSRLAQRLINDVRERGTGTPEVLEKIVGEVNRLHAQWSSLWTKHGERPEGWPEFHRVLDQFRTAIKGDMRKVLHQNGGDLVESLLRALVGPALNPELAPIYAAAEAPLAEAQAATVQAAEAQAAEGMAAEGEPVEAAAGHSASVEAVSPLASPTAANGDAQRSPARLATPHVEASPAVGTAAGPDPRLDRPVIILAAPRSGSTLLFETLAKSPELWTNGKESHSVFEGAAELHPAIHHYESNRLTAADATPAVIHTVREAFWTSLSDREGCSTTELQRTSVRLLEKTPKNALRLPFLQAVFPDALFIYLYREPAENIASIIEAWRSQRFVTYPQLPGWSGPPWSFLLIPGWQNLRNRSLAEIAAAQYRVAHEVMLDDLQQLPAHRWTAIQYEQLVSAPQQELERLCKFAGVSWDQQLTPDSLPWSRYTLTPPSADKWRAHQQAIEGVLPSLNSVVQRAHAALRSELSMAGRRDVPDEPARPAPSPPPNLKQTASPSAGITLTQQVPFRCVNSTSFPAILQQLGISLAVSTYQAGKLILLRARHGRLNAHFRSLPMAMGLASDGTRLVVGTKMHVWEFRNQPLVARSLSPAGHDACYVPRNRHVTGDISIHELAMTSSDVWVVNTRFSCLCTLDHRYSFVPRWRPPFVSELAAEDRCHLNGVALLDNRPQYVTCHGAADTPAGWRDHKADGGCVVDVERNEIVAGGLSMPHSPRCYGGQVWVLESGRGSLARLDLPTGRLESLVELPGFTRGLDFSQHIAFVGLSQVRESATFSGIPITEKEDGRQCGIWAVDLRTGQVLGFARFEGGVQEIFAVQVLHGQRYPNLIIDDESIVANTFEVP